MMKLKLIFLLIVIPVSHVAFAQEKAKFNSINMAGIVAGKSGAYHALQTINGINYREWFAGIGTGIDYYRYKSVPLFLDVRTSVAKSSLFVYADLGYNYPMHNKPGKEIYYYINYHFTGGVYNEVGAGYSIKLSHKSKLLFTSGYSYKKINNKVGLLNPCLVAPCPIEYNTYSYGYGRVVFRAGVSLK